MKSTLASVLVMVATATAAAQTPPSDPQPPPAGEPPPGGPPPAAAPAPEPMLAEGPFVPTWRMQASLSSPFGASGFGTGSIGGFQIYWPEDQDSSTVFGLQGEFGYLVTPMFEPSFALGITRFSQSSGTFTSTITETSLVPSLKINFWRSAHLNLFVQPFAGLLLIDVSAGGFGSSQTFTDLGAFGGLELLVTSWGVRLYTGLEWVHGDFSATQHNLLSLPVRWSLFLYF